MFAVIKAKGDSTKYYSEWPLFVVFFVTDFFTGSLLCICHQLQQPQMETNINK